jgi:hypothetical protein
MAISAGTKATIKTTTNGESGAKRAIAMPNSGVRMRNSVIEYRSRELEAAVFMMFQSVSFGHRIYGDEGESQAADTVEYPLQGCLVWKAAGEHGVSVFPVGNGQAFEPVYPGLIQVSFDSDLIKDGFVHRLL